MVSVITQPLNLLRFYASIWPTLMLFITQGNFGSFPNVTSQIIAMNNSQNFIATSSMQVLRSMVDQNLDGELTDWIITSCEHA